MATTGFGGTIIPLELYNCIRSVYKPYIWFHDCNFDSVCALVDCVYVNFVLHCSTPHLI